MFEQLRSIVGDEHARVPTRRDAIGGLEPRAVAAPGSIEELRALMRYASTKGLKLAVIGSGSRLGWGNAPRGLDLVISTRRMDSLLEHSAGDLVASAEAGMPLASLQAAVGRAGQMLALDPPGIDSTLGGVIATNASGPRRLRYGTVRDLLIGITVVLADGTVAKAGGKVVKNVAGYDLGKLFTGSLGTLGAIASVTFRLHPPPAASRLVLAEFGSPEDAGEAVQRILGSTLVPSAIEISDAADSRLRLMVLFEGIVAGVEEQSRTAMQLLNGLAEMRVLDHHADIAAELRDHPSAALQTKGTLLKISHLPSSLGKIIEFVRRMAERRGLEARIHGHAGTGILYVSLPDAVDAAEEMVNILRSEVRPGTVVILAAHQELRKRVDAWGPAGDSLDLMRRVKEQFDPASMLNPGRFVGGI